MTTQSGIKENLIKVLLIGISLVISFFFFKYYSLMIFTALKYFYHYGQEKGYEWVSEKSFIYILLNFFIFIIILFSPFVLIGYLLIKSEERKYQKRIKKLKLQPDLEYLSDISLELTSRQEYKKIRNDIIPILQKMCTDYPGIQELYNAIDIYLREAENFSTPYKAGSVMESPSDYLSLNDKNLKLIKYFETLKKLDPDNKGVSEK